MKFKIPTEFMGVTREEALRLVETEPKNKSKKPEKPANRQVNTPANINGEDYIQVTGVNTLISKRELFKGDSLNWTDSHYKLAESGLYMPNSSLFMAHFMNVREASEGRVILYDGNGKPLSRDEANELWQYFSSTDRTNRAVCWTWLDDLFKKDTQGKFYSETDHRAVKDGSGKWTLPTGSKVTLDTYLEVNGDFADLSFNKQGLADKSSKLKKYEQGKNIYFYQPVENAVAWFFAGSGGAGLSCDGDPAGSDSSLGVFACAEGAVAPKK